MMYFDHEIALFKVEAKNQKDALKILGDEFLKHDLVEKDFINKVIKREAVFPTGIILDGNLGVAIPHTSAIYVKKMQIGFMSLAKPIKFGVMGTEDKEVDVDIIFILAIKDSSKHLDILQKLMRLFKNKVLIDELRNARDKEAYLNILNTAGLIK